MIRRVIWDLDNTLMKRDLQAEEDFFKENLSAEQGLRLISLLSEYEDQFPKFDISMIASFCQQKVNFLVDEDFFRRWFHVHLEHPGSIIDGAYDVLSDLQNEGFENVVLTNDDSIYQKERLRLVGLLPYIQEVYGGEYYFKPREEAYLAACGSHLPRECFMVGDDLKKDVYAPRNFGIVSWHYNPNHRQSDYRYEIDKLEKVKEKIYETR